MRSANEQDVARAKATGKLEENVMYATASGSLVHGKRLGFFAQACAREYIKDGEVRTLVENDDGVIFLISMDELCCHQKKGPAQQPKKPRRKPVKGTKPEAKIPMSADVKLEVGDVVLLENGKRERVTVVDWGLNNEGYPYKTRYWCDAEGKVTFLKCSTIYEGESITHKIIPYQEPVKEEKSPEQEAFEAGYWTPFVATATSVCPEWAKDVKIDLLLKNGLNTIAEERKQAGRYYLWGALSNTAIVAYRKAQR